MSKYPKYRKSENELSQMILQKYFYSGKVTPDKTLEEIVMNQREEILKRHAEKHSIWQGSRNKKWYTKLGTEKRLLGRKERRSLENAIIEFYLTDSRMTVTVDDVFNEWCRYESEHTDHSMKTINEYMNDYKRFLAKTDFISSPIHTITERDIVQVLTSIVHSTEKIPQKRYMAIKTIIRAIFNYARIQMELDCISVKNIMDDLRFPSSAFKETTKNDSSQIFKHSEIKLIKNALKDTDNLLELGILLTIETGVRVGELCALKRDCIVNDYLVIKESEHKAKYADGYRYFIDSPKKDKTRKIILNTEAKQIIRRILTLHENDWLFPNKENPAEWMHAYQFDRAIRRVCRSLGIQERSMHKIRKTYASCLLSQKDAGVTDKLVQAQLGHADIATTHQAYYYDVFDTDEKIKILGNIQIG